MSLELSADSPPAIEPSRLDDICCGFQAGRHIGANVSDRCAALDGDEPIAFEIKTKARRIERVHEAGTGQIANHGAVFGRQRAQIFGAHDTAGAVHILHHHAWITGDMAADIFRK